MENAGTNYVESVDTYLIDEFHWGLHKTLTETIWFDVSVGKLTSPLEFFKFLRASQDFINERINKPLSMEYYFRDLNLSGTHEVYGGTKEFLKSRLWMNRQKILLFHSLCLILENCPADNYKTVISILKRELHTCFREIFFYWEEELNTGVFIELAREIDFKFETEQKIQFLIHKMADLLGKYGFKSDEINTWEKQKKYS